METSSALTDQRDNGVLLVCVPKEINFSAFSGSFTEQRDTLPIDRPTLPIIAGGKKIFVTTKDEISTQDIIKGYNELIGVFEKALLGEETRRTLMSPDFPINDSVIWPTIIGADGYAANVESIVSVFPVPVGITIVAALLCIVQWAPIANKAPS